MRKNVSVPLLLLCVIPLISHADVSINGHPNAVPAKQTQSLPYLRLNAFTNIMLGGLEQGILLQGKDEAKPVLLFLHGGPGVPITPFIRDFDAHAKLQEHFVIVYWDQRGAGRSYHADIPPESMNIEQFLADTYELVEILRKRFSVPKIYLVGHSWGSILGALTVARHPELFHAYVGIGQAVHLVENEKLSYQFVLEHAAASRNPLALRQLTAIGPPPYQSYKEMHIERKWVDRFGGGTRTKSKPPILLGAVNPAVAVDDPFVTTLEWLHGPYFSIEHLWKELQSVNLFQQAPRIEIPVYFLAGRHDYYTPSSIVQHYYHALAAPQGKTFIWFDHSAHSLPSDEPEKFYDILVKRVLPETYH